MPPCFLERRLLWHRNGRPFRNWLRKPAGRSHTRQKNGAAFSLRRHAFLVLFAGRVDGFIGFMVLAWLVSPYGLPLAASWLTERVADFNRMLKSI